VTTPARLTDERLAWLAVRDYCDRQASGHSGGFWLATILTRRGGASTRGEQRRKKMEAYAFIVDDLVRHLSPEERAHLRASKTLPDWFLPRVDEEFRAMWKANT
jgi:hypothetical protein